MKKFCVFLVTVVSVMSMNGAGLGNAFELPKFNLGKAVWIVRAGVGFNGVVGDFKETMSLSWDKRGWEGEFKDIAGYDFSIGFNKSFGKHPLYWGMDLAFGMRGYKQNATYYKSFSAGMGGYQHQVSTNSAENYELKTYNVQLTPFIIGYKYSFLKRMAADVHVGPYASYDCAGKYNMSTERHVYYGASSIVNKTNETHESNESSVKINDISEMNKYDIGFNLGIGYWFGHFNIDFTWQRGFIPIYDNGDDMVSIGEGKNAQKRKQGNLYSNNFQLRLGYAF